MTLPVRLRRGTAAQWALANPVIPAGEPVVEKDTGLEKRGDGVTHYNDLPYIRIDSLGANGLAALTALESGGAELYGYEWPQWGYGGSTTAKNANSPTLLDLEDMGVDGLIWLPGVGFSTLDNSITTPFTTNMAGNVSGVAQRVFVDFDIMPNEYDPVSGQSTYYIQALLNARWFYLDETGYLVLKFRNSAKTLFTAISTEQYAPKKRLRGYYDLQPNNSDAGHVWTVDIYVLNEGSGTYENFGDQIVGTQAITAYKEVLTDQSDVPYASQSLFVGSNITGQVFRGGIIHLATRIGSHTATPVVELRADAWARVGTPTFTDAGRTWTLHNPQTDNFVTQSCLASVGTALGEYATLTGSSDAPITPVQVATTRGLYTEINATGFHWEASSATAKAKYTDANSLVNLGVTPARYKSLLSITPQGEISLDSNRVFQQSQELATHDFVGQSLAGARQGAVSQANQYSQSITDDLLASLANAQPFRDDELDLVPGDRRIYGNLVWEVLEDPHGLPPMGTGTGSPADQAFVLAQASSICAAAGITGGFGADPTYLTSNADNAVTPPAGSLRKIWKDFNAAWKADPTSKLYLVARPEDLTLDGEGAAHIALDYSSTDRRVRDMMLLAQNVTIDFSAIPGGVIIDGGGKPGPVPYCTTNAIVTAGAGSHTLTTASVLNFGTTKLTVGALVDVGKYVSGVWTIYGKELVVTAINYDNPGARPPSGGGSIVVTGTMDADAPSGSTVILALNPPHNDPTSGVRTHLEPGVPGCQVIIGGEAYSDMFGPWTSGYVNKPAGNIIIRNMAIRSNWGGDVLDTGDLNDFAISYYTNNVWLDGCDWSNPDPFHDTMWQTAKGAQNIGTTFCAFKNHYKAVNHFGGNSGSGGVSPDGTTPSPNVHVFPPGYDESNPGPYLYEPGIVGSHGNPTGAPVVIMTVLHEYALFEGNGQRTPKNDHFGDLHLLKSVIKDYGLPPGDPNLGVSTRFPLDPLEGPLGPAPLISNDGAKTLYECVSIIPHINASGGGLKGIKHSPTGKSPSGFTKAVDLSLTGAVVNEPDYDPDGKIPNFSARYSYTVEPAAVYERKVFNGAGAGTRSKMWQLIGPASVSATIVVKHDGADIGPAGTLGVADTINFVGGTVTYDDINRIATVTAGGSTPSLEDLTPTAVKTANYTGVSRDLSRFDTTSGALVLTLPTAPADGTNVGAQITAGSNTLSVNCGGSDHFDISSTGPTSKTLRVTGRTRVWEYVAASSVWVERENMPLAAVTMYPAFTFLDPLTVRSSAKRYYVEDAWTIVKVRISAGTAPTGSSLIVDVKKNGTSIFATTPANRPSIASGSTTGVSGVPDTISLSGSDYLSCDVTQIGSTTPGADLTVQVQLQRL